MAETSPAAMDVSTLPNSHISSSSTSFVPHMQNSNDSASKAPHTIQLFITQQGCDGEAITVVQQDGTTSHTSSKLDNNISNVHNMSNGHVNQTVTNDGTQQYTFVSHDQLQESNVIPLNSQDQIYNGNENYSQALNKEKNQTGAASTQNETKPVVIKHERPFRNRRAPVMPGMILLDDNIRSISRTSKPTVKVKKEKIPEQYLIEEMVDDEGLICNMDLIDDAEQDGQDPLEGEEDVDENYVQGVIHVKQEDKKGIVRNVRKRKRGRIVFNRKIGKVYRCDYCPAIFARETQLKCHLKLHTDGKSEKHECESCGVVFGKLNKLMKHRQGVHQEALSCQHCNSQFTHVNSYRLHMRLHSGEKPYECNECGAKFVQSSHLNIHKRSHTGEKPYQCDVCKVAFKQISHLRTHERIHTQHKPYSCDVCGSAFIQKSSLNRHARIHTGEKPYVCTICQAAFCVKNNLTRHMITHTGEQPYQCDMCPATFGQAIDLKRHKIAHTGIKPFRCEICDASFSRKNNLKWHKYTHTGEMPFKCDLPDCIAEFNRPRDLKKHKLSHTPRKPHTCQVCPEEFPQLSLLKRHMMIHTGEKPLTCDKCFATFVDKSSLKRHMYKHVGLKPFACQRCDSTFREFRSLKRHCIQVHGEEPPDEKEAEVLVQQQQETIQQIQQHHPPPTQQLLQPGTIITSQEPQHITYTTAMPTTQQQQMAQIPTLMLSGGPGQPARMARPANNCQNHTAHVLTFGANNQWQSWCFCETSNQPQNIQVTGTAPQSIMVAATLANTATQVTLPISTQVTIPVSTQVTHVNHQQQQQQVLTHQVIAAPQGTVSGPFAMTVKAPSMPTQIQLQFPFTDATQQQAGAGTTQWVTTTQQPWPGK